MTSITIHKDDYDADSTPKNDDGEEFALVMVGQDQIVFSDGYGALNAALFDDEYADLDPEGQLEKRHDLAVILATSVQGNVVSNLLEKEALRRKSTSFSTRRISRGSPKASGTRRTRWVRSSLSSSSRRCTLPSPRSLVLRVQMCSTSTRRRRRTSSPR